MRYNLPSKKGFALIELIVVIGILATLFSMSAVNLLPLREKATLTAAVDTFITYAKAQQTRSFLGDTQGTGITDSFSIYLEPTRYTLFLGNVYSASNTTNFVINLENGIEIPASSVTFPASTITFSQGEGEVVGGQNSLVIKNTFTGEERTISINQLGAISIN